MRWALILAGVVMGVLACGETTSNSQNNDEMSIDQNSDGSNANSMERQAGQEAGDQALLHRGTHHAAHQPRMCLYLINEALLARRETGNCHPQSIEEMLLELHIRK